MFAEVEKCDRKLCQHDTIDMIAWMTNVSKPKKVATVTSSLAKIQLKRTMHCWRCDKFGLIKNDPNYFKKKKTLCIEKSKSTAKIAKIGDKPKKKQLKCIQCNKLNNNEDNCIILYSYKYSTSNKKKSLEAKIIELKKRFNNITSLSQVIRIYLNFRSKTSFFI